jgi:hypothetical protein
VTLRAIISHRMRDPVSLADWETFETLDFDCPALEAILTRGGLSDGAYDISTIHGIEVRARAAGQTEGGRG